MVCAQTHRGPDDSGEEFVDLGEHTLGLGQRRLSIIDLSPMGHQPMRHPGAGDLLVYNGELYNYQEIRADLLKLGETFRGLSDTEVMLHALVRWGPDVLKRFRGMFAIAWFRRASRTLVLARDPVGIKPLYVSRRRDGLCIASEVRAVVASGIVPRQINRRALAGMLAYGAVQHPETIFEGVRSFPAGCYQELPLDTVLDREPKDPVRYWHWPAIDPRIDEEEAFERTRASLRRSVREHLVSDVPVGVFLSSGVDSTIIAGLAAEQVGSIHTYTVGFSDNPDMSESPIAAETAKHFGLPHVDVQVTGREALDSAQRWLEALDQPSIDGLNTYVVSRAVKRAGLTVALSGLGGDELFCGYSTFVDVPRLKALMAHATMLPVPLRSILARVAAIGRPLAYKHKLLEIAQTDGGVLDLYLQRRRVMSGQKLAELGIDWKRMGLTNSFMPRDAFEDIRFDENDPASAVSILEIACYCGNMLLRDSDTNGMAHSLEIRVPFFDTGVLDAILPIPAHVRMPARGRSKHLLRSAFGELLPPPVRSLGKRGFSLPIRRWMATSLRESCEESLRDLKRSGLLDPRGIDRVWSSFLAEPETPIWSRAFALCVMGAYVRRLGAVARESRVNHASSASDAPTLAQAPSPA